MCDLGLPCGDPYCPFTPRTPDTEELTKVEPDEDVNRDRPWDKQDPWRHQREVSPTHMNF